MPLRGLIYINMVYQGYIAQHHLDLYSSTLLKLPTPRYIVFYNGTGNEPDQQELWLSDSFIQQDGSYYLECRATVLKREREQNAQILQKAHPVNPPASPSVFRVQVAAARRGIKACQRRNGLRYIGSLGLFCHRLRFRQGDGEADFKERAVRKSFFKHICVKKAAKHGAKARVFRSEFLLYLSFSPSTPPLQTRST